MSILIADSGSTKTDWVLLHNEQPIIEQQTSGFSPYFQTSEAIHKEISKNLFPVLKEHLGTITHVVYYGTGCSTPDKIKVIEDALKLSFGKIIIEVNHDLLASARALCGNQKGIACILGTGSNSCLFDGKSILENVPSLGFMFGDYGSGAHIGKTFIQQYFDGLLPTQLHKAFEEAGYNREVILENVYKKPMPNTYLASVLSFIRNYNSDSFIQELIKTCFAAFFDSQVCKYTNAKELPIHFVGSVGFYYKELLQQVAQRKGFMLGSVIKSPIEGLITYHTL